MRRKAIIGILISVAFLVYALWDVDFAQLWARITQANWYWLIPNIILAVGAGMFLRAWRWMLIMRPIGNVRYRHALAATMIGFMANNVLPARLGEVARAVSIGFLTGVSRSATLATIVIERIFDSFTLLVFLWLVFAFSRISELTDVAYVRKIGWVFLAVNVILVLILIVLQWRNDMVVRFVHRLTRFLPRKIEAVSAEVTEKFARGLTVHHNWPTTIGVIVLSFILWFIMGASNYFVFLSVGVKGLPLEASFVVLVVVSLLISIPSSPGYVGVFHTGVIESLKIYGVSSTDAAAVAFLLHAAQYIPITLLGFYYLKKEHLKLSSTGETETAEGAPPPAGP